MTDKSIKLTDKQKVVFYEFHHTSHFEYLIIGYQQ